MALKKGHNKLGGREKGTSIINTKKLKILLREVLENEIENISTYFESGTTLLNNYMNEEETYSVKF